MSKIQFRTALSYKVGKSSYEKPHGDSVAVPNEAYTARELYDKYVTGNVPPIYRNGQYIEQEDDETSMDLEKISRMDLVEIDQVRDLLNSRARKLREQLQKASEDKAKKAEEEQPTENPKEDEKSD